MAILDPCTVCGAPTLWRCGECGVNIAGERITAICARQGCREEHEESHRSQRGEPMELDA